MRGRCSTVNFFRLGLGSYGVRNISLRNDRMCGDSCLQVAEALGHLPDVGYVQVLKTADGTEQNYTANGTVGTFFKWEWKVTFVTEAGDQPLMAAVWSDGRTLRGQDDGFEVSGRAARLTCSSCEAFGSSSWSSSAEKALGLRMEVRTQVYFFHPLRRPKIQLGVEAVET